MEPKGKRKHADDLRAAVKLALLATTGVTDVVEDMHRTIGSGPRLLGRPLALPMRVITKVSYGMVRGVTRLVGAGLDAALEELEPFLGESAPGPERDAVLAVLNGVVGDHLVDTKSTLAIEMELRRGEVQRAELGEHVLVLVHGSAMNDRQWLRKGHDHGAALARDLGLSPVYALYNSGLHISTNGRKLARLLDELPGTRPITLLGHSMGGLVARSACHVAEAEGLAWRKRLRRLVTLGTPHHGAPLERGGLWASALLGVSAYSAPLERLARIRSAGVTDLRFGNVLDEHWQGRDRFALEGARDARRELTLPEGVACYAIAGGADALVPESSALGRHARPELTLAFPEAHLWVAEGASHLDLLDRADVYAQLRRWLEAPA